MNDLISVLIPAYNHEKYVQEAIQSIIDQTYKNIELLIIDDGSSDSTLSKINELKTIYEQRFFRVVVQTQENQGTCTTLNKLLALSKGEYIYMLASDDKVTSNALETLHGFLSKNDEYSLVVGENLFIDSEGKQCYWDNNQNIVYKLEEASFPSFSDFLIKIAGLRGIDFLSDDFGSYASLLVGNYIPNGCLIRKSIFEKISPFTNEAPLEDYYLMLQLSKYSKMKYLPLPLFYYRWHSNNTASQRAKMIEKTRQTFFYEIKHIRDFKDPKIQQTILNHLDLVLKATGNEHLLRQKQGTK